MQGRRALWAVALGLAGGVGVVSALPVVANRLPQPLSTVAHLPERLATKMFPPHVSRKPRLTSLTEPERAAATSLGSRLDGLIVWSSNRSGHHELYLLDPRAGSVRQLTYTPSVNFFGRFSPDGTRISFVRSQKKWVSVRDATAWDVYLINVDGTGERRLAVGGYHPTWTADGKSLVFYRGTRVYRYDLAREEEGLLLDVAQTLPGVDEFGDVELSPDGGRLAFPLRGSFSGVFGLQGSFSGAAVYDLRTPALALLTREQACETTWAPDGQSLLWMETGGNGGTRVMTGRPDGTGRQVFMDLPGPRSHEYFPKLSNDGRWLVWAATDEGHEQDRANYEVFVWEVGTPWDTAIRLTHQAGNSNWPDLWVRPRGSPRGGVGP